jgi:cobalamin biosynthesis protein CbiG
MRVAGLGCRQGCTAAEFLALIEAAQARTGRLAALAAPAFKQAEAGLIDAAARLELPLLWIDAARLRAAQPRCATVSARVAAATGHASIAEACALAAAGATARLLLARIAGPRATCAVAGP